MHYLYNSLVFLHLEYGLQFWGPSYRKKSKPTEENANYTTKFVPSLRNKNYGDCLRNLKFFLRETWKLHDLLIEVFKTLFGSYNVDYGFIFQLSKELQNRNGFKHELKLFHNYFCENLFSYKSS